MRIRLLVLMLAIGTVTAFAQDGEAKKQPALVKGVMWVKTLIDSMAVNGIDRNYIEQPKLPWAVELRTTASHSAMMISADTPLMGLVPLNTETASDNGLSMSVGAWLGYRGYGFGFSKELSSGSGSTLSFGAMGGSFGINLRINNYRSEMPTVTMKANIEDSDISESAIAELDDPIKVRTLFVDGYYMFNGKHFSYAAAYDQSLIQRRSAGSLAAGVMYYHASIAFDEDSNWPLVRFLNYVGKMKLTQASAGLGYAYNWVPARGWLVSAMFMPMLTFHNKTKIYRYDLYDAEGNPYSDDVLEYDDAEDLEYTLREKDVTKTNNRVGWNFDARLCMSYNWSRYYARVYAHYNRFRYSNDTSYGRLTDWTAYAALGVRF